VISAKPDRPYFEAWLRRAGRRLAVSGKLSEIAMVLAKENDGDTQAWRQQLYRIMQGEDIPSLDLLTRIDALLVGPHAAKHTDPACQELLF